MKITTAMQTTKKNNDEKTEDKKSEEEEAMADMSKTMNYMMPIMSVSIALIAPLGLALYWLVNNLLMIIERLVINKVCKDA
jgi:membrane protein insertase Oxa1/YidC/SpoIIIJ